MRGATWGKYGGRPKKEDAPGEASKMAKLGLVRPQKFGPRCGHLLQGVRYIAEQLYAKNLGKVLEPEKGIQGWEEPEAPDIEDKVWAEIRLAGFGKTVKSRDVKRLWARRRAIRQQVEVLELGKAGGVFRRTRRSPSFY